MRISDWSSDVCSSDLLFGKKCADHQAEPPIDPVCGQCNDRYKNNGSARGVGQLCQGRQYALDQWGACHHITSHQHKHHLHGETEQTPEAIAPHGDDFHGRLAFDQRSEEHTSELQSLMRISYAVFCLKKK